MTRTFILTALAAAALAAPAAAAPNLDDAPHRPDFQTRLDPGHSSVLVPCRRPSDLHVYTRAGRPLHQYRTGRARHTFRSRSGRTVATFRNGRFTAHHGRVIVAAWCG